MSKSISAYLVLIIITGVFSAIPLRAESPENYAAAALTAWKAFECSVLAEKIKNTAEQERLFKFGYDTGRIFIAALQAGKMSNDDLPDEISRIIRPLLQGPTPDFILGRIFENAVGSALKNVPKTGENPNSEEFQKLIAGIEYRKRSCQLLGRQ